MNHLGVNSQTAWLISVIFLKSLLSLAACRCFHYPDLSEFCLYNNVCLVNGKIIVVHKYKKGTISSTNPGIKGNYHHYRTAHVPRFIPFRGFTAITFQPSLPENVDMLNRTAFLAFFDTETHNPFHFAEKVMVADLANYMLNIQFDHVYLDKISLSAWEHNLASIVFNVNYTTRGTPLGSRVCFARAMLPGTSIFMFLGTEQAVRFRNKTLDWLKEQGDKPCSLQITFVNRAQHQGRHIKNHEELVAIARKYGHVDYLDSFESLSATDQIRTMMTTRILISSHGAGLTNVMFMRTGGTVLELFQPHYNYYLYERIAHQSGVRHVFVNTQKTVPSLQMCDPDSSKFMNISSADCLKSTSCASKFKGCDLVVEPDKFEYALQSALDIVDQEAGCMH